MSLSRRQFLRASACSMAVAAAPTLTFAETMLQPIADRPPASPINPDVKQDVVARNSIGQVWGVRTPYYQRWPDRVD